MTTAIILINVERAKLKKTAEQIKAIEGVSSVYIVAGEYDLVAMLKLNDISKLSKTLTEKMSAMDGITHTRTLLALDMLSN